MWKSYDKPTFSGTVRRFLEKYGEAIDLIVFVVEDVDVGIYELLMPLYYPRSKKEEEYALYYLPKDIGGENGEAYIPERQMRIVERPFKVEKDGKYFFVMFYWKSMCYVCLVSLFK